MPAAAHIALMAALPLPAPVEGAAPDWVHLLPASGAVDTYDGRGPYHLGDIPAVIAASLSDPRGLPIDENHATDLAAPEGREAPARGWIVELQARADGIWGRVEWTTAGAALVADRAYRGISPVLAIDRRDRKSVLAIRRASLVNIPNLRGLTALNQETSMSLMERLIEKLGLTAGASEDDVVAAAAPIGTDTALQSALTEIGTALGVAGSDTAAVILAAKSAAKAKPAEITALQQQLAGVTTELNTIKAGAARKEAERVVDAEIQRGRVGVLPLRDHYVTRHMANPAEVEKELAVLPVLMAGGIAALPPAAGADLSLNAEQKAAARLLGIPEADYLKTLKAEKETA